MTNGWTLPKARAVIEVRMDDGAIVYVRRHGNPEGARIILSHGNGLSADAYYPYWSLLAARFDLFVFDFRNHGWNPVGDQQAHTIPNFVQDIGGVVRAIDRNFGEQPVVGVFHSVTGLPALLYMQGWGGAAEENAFSALVLFDLPFRHPRVPMVDFSYRISLAAQRRRNWFESREEFANRYRNAPVFRRLVPGAVELLAETTLRPVPGGDGYELCCPREYEAQIAEFTFGWGLEVNLSKVPCPVKAIGADPTEQYSFYPSMDLSELTRLDYDFLPEATHFLQLEDPERCFGLTIDFLESHGLM